MIIQPKKQNKDLKIQDKATYLNLLQQIALFQSKKTGQSFSECLKIAVRSNTQQS